MLSRRALMWVAGIGIASGTTLAWSSDWEHWRGPLRSGSSSEASGFQDNRSWIGEQPAWEIEIGEGASSPIVANGRVFVMGWNEGQDHVAAFDLATGNELWRASYDSPLRGREATGDESFYSGPSSTPEFDSVSQKVLTLSIDGELRCWQGETGELVWRKNLYDQYPIPRRARIGRSGQRDYGFTSSPLVLGDQVIVEVGSSQGTVMSFSLQTGDLLWTSEATEGAGHSGAPVPITVDGLACVAVFALRHLLVIQVEGDDAGRTVASFKWETDFANNIPTPAVKDQSILITTKYNHQAICRIDISREGATKIWEQTVASGVCSPVIHKGRIYWSSHEAYCLDFESGEVIWRGGRFGDAGSCIATTDDRLIVWAGNGQLALLDIPPENNEFRELFRRGLGADSDAWPHVAFSNQSVIVKTREGKVRCFRVQ